MVEREGVLQAVRGHVPVRPGAADVVHEYVEARVDLIDLGGEAPHLGLRRQVGLEHVDLRGRCTASYGIGRGRATGDGASHDPDAGAELLPVGKAYFGFTDEELRELDRYVRNHTVNRFGPVREVEYGKDRGLVLEVAFEGLQRSTRHKSGVAMRFPRISRIRWDKSAAEADRIETLEKILERGEKEIHPLKEQQTKEA